MTTLTRRYRFSASHRLHLPALCEAENARLFGKCNNPFGHGHDYVLEVTVAGKSDARTGQIISLTKLNRLVEREVLDKFSHRNMNLDVAEFSDLVPTTENVAVVIAGRLQAAWPAHFAEVEARLCGVYVRETARNGFELRVSAPAATGSLGKEEKVEVHA